MQKKDFLQEVETYFNKKYKEALDEGVVMDNDDWLEYFNYGYHGNLTLTRQEEKEAIENINSFYERFKDNFEEDFNLSTSKEILDTLWYVEGFRLIWNKMEE